MDIVTLALLVVIVLVLLLAIRFGMGRVLGLAGAALVTKLLWIIGFGSMSRGIIILALIIALIGFAAGSLRR